MPEKLVKCPFCMKKYYGKDRRVFVNGVLGKFVKTIESI